MISRNFEIKEYHYDRTRPLDVMKYNIQLIEILTKSNSIE